MQLLAHHQQRINKEAFIEKPIEEEKQLPVVKKRIFIDSDQSLNQRFSASRSFDQQQ